MFKNPTTLQEAIATSHLGKRNAKRIIEHVNTLTYYAKFTRIEPKDFSIELWRNGEELYIWKLKIEIPGGNCSRTTIEATIKIEDKDYELGFKASVISTNHCLIGMKVSTEYDSFKPTIS